MSTFLNLYFENIYIIGDSISDTGTLIQASKDILLKLSLEQKTQFEVSKIHQFSLTPPYENNCLTNGNTFPYWLSQLIDKPLLPAWNYQTFNVNSISLGQNYSCIGARIKCFNFITGLGKIIFNEFNLENQVYAILKQHHKAKHKDLLIVNIGTNDLIFAKIDESMEENINFLINELQKNLQLLIKHGFKNIIIFEIMDLGKIPRFINDFNLSIKMSNMSQLFNEKLKKTMNLNIEKNANLKIKIYPFFSIIKDLKTDFEQKEFDNLKNEVCKLDLNSMMNKGIITPKNFCIHNSKSFFVDDVHFTEEIHKKIAKNLFLFINKF